MLAANGEIPIPPCNVGLRLSDSASTLPNRPHGCRGMQSASDASPARAYSDKGDTDFAFYGIFCRFTGPAQGVLVRL